PGDRMRILFFLACLVVCLPTAARAEHIKIGILKTTASGPIFIASAKGYFAAEGLEDELVFFASAQPIAVATASGAIDFGNAGFTGGFYGLAGDGALRIISGGASEVPGYHNQAFLASNKAWSAGLRSLKDMPGHSFAVSQIGSRPKNMASTSNRFVSCRCNRYRRRKQRSSAVRPMRAARRGVLPAEFSRAA